MFIILFTRIPYLFLSCSRWIQAMQSLSSFLKITLVLILRYMHRSSKWSFSFRCSSENPVSISPVPFVCQVPHPSHLPQLNSPNNICWGKHIMNWYIICYILCINLNTLRTGSFKLFKRPFPGFLTILINFYTVFL